MKIRKLSFGYCIRNGEVCVDERSADTVRMIFDRYIRGESYGRLADSLRSQQTPYIPGKQWNKNIVARILKDRHYTGDDIYPPLLPQKIFQNAAAANSWSCESPEQIRILKNMRALVRCPSCGKSMARNFRANWRCPDCMETSVKVTDEALIMCLTELLAQLIRKAPDIRIPEFVPDTASTQGLEAKLSQLLSGNEFDENASKAKTMALTAAQFEALGSEDYETMKIKYLLSNKEQDGELDAVLLFDIASAILIYPTGAVSLKLKNGQIIERSDSI